MRICQFCTEEATLTCKCDLKKSTMCIDHVSDHPGGEGHKIIPLYQKIQNRSDFLRLLKSEINRTEEYKNLLVQELKAGIEKLVQDFQWKTIQMVEKQDNLIENLKFLLSREKVEIGVYEEIIAKSERIVNSRDLPLCRTSLSIQCGDFKEQKERLFSLHYSKDPTIVAKNLLELQSELGPYFLSSTMFMIVDFTTVEHASKFFAHEQNTSGSDDFFQIKNKIYSRMGEFMAESSKDIMKFLPIKEVNFEINAGKNEEEFSSIEFIEEILNSFSVTASIENFQEFIYEAFQNNSDLENIAPVIEMLYFYAGSNLNLKIEGFKSLPNKTAGKVKAVINHFFDSTFKESINKLEEITTDFIGVKNEIAIKYYTDNFGLTITISSNFFRKFIENLLKIKREKTA